MARTSETRENLLAAAIELISAQSYGSVSVDDICEKAGVKKGSFYHFFPSKEELAVEAYEAFWKAEVQPWYERIFRADIPPRERLSAWCDENYEEQKEAFEATGHVPGCPFCSIGAEMGTQSERLRLKSEELLERSLIHIERALREGQRDGSLRNVTDPPAQARAICTFGLGAMLQAKMKNDPEVLRDLKHQVLALLGASVSI
jgi:TetR/AcrR family transcriptional regulator, transcriptional repressor for nem operon